jgi:hypothetical protein
MEMIRLPNVAFCGENPHVVLMQPGTETVTAATSFWHCTYSPQGEGDALLVYLDAANAAALKHPTLMIYADNAPLARYLTDTFNQHFDGWKNYGFRDAPIKAGRFFKESDTRQFHRVACHSEHGHITLEWGDFRYSSFGFFPDLDNGGWGAAGDEHYHVSNMMVRCAKGSIIINQQPASGEPQTQTLADGRFASSVFLALSETWIRM